MKSFQFYNRVKERKQLVECIGPACKSGNKVILIKGNTGVGKSGLVRKILQDDLKERATIIVSISKVSPDRIENLHYINVLYRRVAQLASEHFFDAVLSPVQHGLLSLKNMFRFITGVFWSKFVGSENRFFEPTEDISVLRKKNYIIKAFKKGCYIIDIENIQNIDAQSLELLRDILAQSAGLTLILEYTIDKDHSEDCFAVFYNELLTANAELSAFTIEMLDFKEAKQLAPSNVSEEMLQKIYTQGEGNLVKVILSGSVSEGNMDPIQARLSSLTKDERFLLNLIYLNGGSIEKPILNQILVGNLNAPPFSPMKITKTLSNLMQQNILQENANNLVSIFHDSILAELMAQKAEPILYSAFNILKSHYFERLMKNSDEYTVRQLFRLCIMFSDSEIIKLFPFIKELLRKCKYPEDILRKIEFFRNETLTTISYENTCEISLFLTTVCLEFGLVDEAQRNLDYIYSSKNPYHRALQAAIYTTNFPIESNLDKARMLEQQAQTPRERLTIQLCLLAADMARLPTSQSIQIAETLLSTDEYKSLFEYGFLLRDYAELAQKYSESISLCQRAIQRFAACGRSDLCSQVYISLCMFYAYQGNLPEAYRALQSAKGSNSVPEHYMLNNLAVLDLLGNKISDQTVENLSDALLICTDSYEKTIILCNLLVCYTTMRDMERAEQALQMLEAQEYRKFQYEEFLHIIYQDILYYHATFGNTKAAEEISESLYQLVENAPGTMAQRIGKLQLSGTIAPDEFFSQFPFRVDFLGNWNIEISRELERCQ